VSIPVGFAVTVPAQALTHRLHWTTALVTLGFTLVVVAGSRWFWRCGLRRYSGASA
jgi:ABC-2 type transport system permease protein